MVIRRFQFRLRTPIICLSIVAVIGAYLAYEARVVSVRNVWLGENSPMIFRAPPRMTVLATGNADARPYFLRRWLGDTAQDRIVVPADASAKDKQRAIALFPEAKVSAWELP